MSMAIGKAKGLTPMLTVLFMLAAWVDDDREGQGTMTLTNGDVYVGSMSMALGKAKGLTPMLTVLFMLAHGLMTIGKAKGP